MKSGSFVFSLLASVALAQPHKQHRHQHQPRAQVIEWVTEWAVETEVVAVTETVWVSEGYVAPTTLSTSASTTSSKRVPAQFFQPVSKSKASSSPSSTSSPAPSSTTVVVAPPPVSTTPVAPAPAPPAPSTTPVVEISTSTTSAAPAPSSEPVQAQVPAAKVEPVAAPVTTSAAAAAPTAATGSGSSGGPCSSGSPCTGDITHYDAGLGACGWETNGDSENVVALSHLLMGTQSNGNPFCGQTVTITLNGKSVTAKVVDKCMGCQHDDLDLSNKAFQELEDMGVGRTQATWHFN